MIDISTWKRVIYGNLKYNTYGNEALMYIIQTHKKYGVSVYVTASLKTLDFHIKIYMCKFL